MAKIVVMDDAQADLEEMLEYLERQDGIQLSQRYRADFDKLVEQLCWAPESRPARPRIGRNVRIGIIDPYIVLHRYDQPSDTVTVLRIVHGKRKITKDLMYESRIEPPH